MVHLAHDELLDRPVAVKRIGLLPGTTADDVVRAQREARLAAGINHAHVVSIFDLVKDEDCYWLVMEHVDGRTLSQLVADEGPLPERRAAAIVAQAADALVQAGTAGIVHRDVKPSNIIISGADHAKLGDFGIARAASDTALTQTGLITGSPAYIAPEVASGQPATEASDVWSLGATLYHAVAGKPPYDVGDNVLGGLYKIVNGDPPRLPDDHATAGLLAVMMVKDPARRWSAQRVRDDLRRIAREEPSQAPVPNRDEGATAVMTAQPGRPPVQELDATTRTTAAPVASGERPPPAVADDVPAPTPPPPTAHPKERSRGLPLGWVAAVLALVLVAGVGAWLLWPRGEEPGDAGGSSASAEPSASEDPTSESPSESPPASEEPTTEPTPSNAATGTPAAMRAFVQDYFARVTSDPESTFAMLTPEFQAASGGFEGYTGFWSTIESATPRSIRADPRTLTTSYTIDFVTTSGQSRTEQGRLRLEQQGDGFLIADEG